MLFHSEARLVTRLESSDAVTTLDLEISAWHHSANVDERLDAVEKEVAVANEVRLMAMTRFYSLIASELCA